MFRTGKIDDFVQGVAVKVPKYAIQTLDAYYNVPVEFVREEMYVKPTDLGPLYRPPFKAIVYYMVLNKETPFELPSLQEILEVAKTIYFHNKL